jgi:hypothetical protein
MGIKMSDKSTKLPQSNRRSFLKGSSLAAAAAIIDPKLSASAPADVAQTAASPNSSDTIDLANVLQGTNSTYAFSRGNTLPIAAVPFGMAHWTLQSDAGTPWMFHPDERRLQGFRCTHQLSPWLSDYGQAVFLPFSGDIKPAPGERSSSWRPEKSELRPYSFHLSLMRYEIDAELIPTTRCAIIAAGNRSGLSSGFLIEIPGHPDPVSSVSQDLATHTIRFRSTINEGGVPPNFATPIRGKPSMSNRFPIASP